MPQLIQGGMGVGVSAWPLARAVSMLGQLGVVSGTALDSILVRRLGSGDPGGHVRRALAAFPAPHIAQRVLDLFFRPDGRTGGASPIVLDPDADADAEASSPPAAQSAHAKQRYTLLPLPRATLTPQREWLMILANFVEVYLAKEGHNGVVGINYLHKVQFPVLPSLYGAMLAGVDVVLMGAGIPGDIPAVLDRLAAHESASVVLDVLDAGDHKHLLTFDPARLWATNSPCRAPTLRRPQFLAIVSSATLARALLKKAPGGINGFVVEAPTAGGHNAPPRGTQQLSVRGEPIYGPRDDADLSQMVALGSPFWLAGGYATRERFNAALAAGAHGIQVGTVFAFCEESGLDPALRRRFLAGVLRGEADVFTDPLASPTSFPFKVAALAGTISEPAVYAARTRSCDLGYLRRAYAKPDGTVGYRCPAEPEADFVHKGGKPQDTLGRKCLCNALLANIGLGQQRPDGYDEPPLLTSGEDLECVKPYITAERLSYHARDVVESLMATA